jgi:hypothetical protein
LKIGRKIPSNQRLAGRYFALGAIRLSWHK